MSQHSSFKSGGSASSKKRSVLKRFERIDQDKACGITLPHIFCRMANIHARALPCVFLYPCFY